MWRGRAHNGAQRRNLVFLPDLFNRDLLLPVPEELAKRSKAAAPMTLKELYRQIWSGSFPALALNNAMDRDLFYGSYVQTYLQRDVRDLARVGDEMSFITSRPDAIFARIMAIGRKNRWNGQVLPHPPSSTPSRTRRRRNRTLGSYDILIRVVGDAPIVS